LDAAKRVQAQLNKKNGKRGIDSKLLTVIYIEKRAIKIEKRIDKTKKKV